MGKTSATTRHSRRVFLKQMAVAGGAVGTALTSRLAAAGAPEPGPGQAAAEAGPSGYRETAHVREYYSKAAF